MLPVGSIVRALYHKLQTQSSAPEDGRNYRPKQVELIEIINKPLLLHLDGYLYYWKMGFNSVFKGLIALVIRFCMVSCAVVDQSPAQQHTLHPSTVLDTKYTCVWPALFSVGCTFPWKWQSVNFRNVLSDSDLPVWPALVSPAADVFKVNSTPISFGREMLHRLSHCFRRPFKNLLDTFDNITSPFPVRQVRVCFAVCHTGWSLCFLPITMTQVWHCDRFKSQRHFPWYAIRNGYRSWMLACCLSVLEFCCFLFFILRGWSQDCRVGTVIRLRPGRSTNSHSIPAWGIQFLNFKISPLSLGPPNFVFIRYWSLFTER